MKFDLNIHIASRLIGGDTFPIPDHKFMSEKFVVEFDYPLRSPATVSYSSPADSTTLEQLVDRICKTYQTVYEEEERTQRLKTERTYSMWDADLTEGDYGIWGHSLEELWIEGITIDGTTVELSIGSFPSPFWILGFGRKDFGANITPRRHGSGFAANGEVYPRYTGKVIETFEVAALTLDDLIERAKAMAGDIVARLNPS